MSAIAGLIVDIIAPQLPSCHVRCSCRIDALTSHWPDCTFRVLGLVGRLLVTFRKFGSGSPCPRRLEALQRAAADEDGPMLIDVGHGLRGMAAHFGAHELVSLCEVLEELARGSTPAGAMELVENMDQAFERARAALMKLRPATAIQRQQ